MLKSMRNCVQVFLLDWRTDKANDNFKKINRMKKLFTLMILGAVCLGARAQADGYHIPNGDFSSWKTACGKTYQTSHGVRNGGAYGLVARPGIEPESWNGSNINQTVYVPFFGAQNKQEPGLVTSNANDKHVVLTNKFVGVANIGSNAPAYITFGTPWVYAVSDISSCDGGTYGGIQFKGKPDAIRGTYKRTAAKKENAYIIAYLWCGTFTSDVKCSVSGKESTMSLTDVDKAILGLVASTGDGKLVASCEKSFETTNENDWETIEVPMEYKQDVVPEKMNVIISAADYWTRGNIQEKNILEVNNLSFIYYHSLTSCTYNGQDVAFDDNNAASVNALYDESKLTYEKKGVGATVEKAYKNETGVLTITVKGNDYEADSTSVTTYTIQFYNASATLAVNSAAHYGTFCAPFNVTIPVGVTAYTISGIDKNGILTLEQQNTISAHTPVIVYSESASGINEVQFGVATSGTATSNYLKGVYTDTTAPVGSYVLQNQNGRVGFYQVQAGIQPWVRANRAYLTVPASANVKAFYMDDATAIQTVEELLSGKAEIYDLAGRRQQKLQKGINIVGGKKVLVK